MKITLLFMAAGIGSRFGGGIKQLATVDDRGHIIMDYSIHDAIAAGFNRIVFVIRRDIEQDFREILGCRIEALCREQNVEVCYAFQSLEDIPAGKTLPEGRTKPWGTGQAVLAARDLIDGPFAIVNADDFYGREAFQQLYDFLSGASGETNFCMAGFRLKNTLSENGGVTRGICRMDSAGFLTDVQETTNIVKTPEGASANGKLLDPEVPVSMNMWGLGPRIMPMLEGAFAEFFDTQVPGDSLKSEFLIPVMIGKFLQEGKITVKVLETGDKWFGVTYQEDRDQVIQSIRGLIRCGIYREDLYSDL